MINRKTALALAALAALSIGSQALSQEVKTLKFSSVFPSTHWHWTESGKVFTEAVTKASGGKLQFEAYHVGQLGKETTGVLRSGLADLGILVPSYESAKLPLSSVAELPGFHKTACEGSVKLWNMVKDGGPLYEAEYKPQGFKPIYAIMMPPYQVMTTKKAVAKMEDMAGLKLRANGSALAKSVRLLGGIPVTVTSNEMYDSLTRGTIDGGLWPISSTRSSSLEKVYRYITVGPMFGGAGTVYAMSQKAWDGLSAKEQAIVMKAGAEAQQHLCTYLDDIAVKETAILAKDFGMTIVNVPDAEVQRWSQRMSSVSTDWAKEMDSTGRPGTQLLKAFTEMSSR